MIEKDKPKPKGKAIRLSVAKREDETPDNETLRDAERLAEKVSPLLKNLFNAQAK